MTDEELLELAAKAAGFTNWTMLPSAVFVETGHSRGNTGFHWNPLTDDGDALRLAVLLDMSVDVAFYESSSYAYAGDSPRVWAVELWRDDKRAATRRAIVRAAAEIGKAKCE
jgi:hypothetical protein